MINLYRNGAIEEFITRYESRRAQTAGEVEARVAGIIADVRDRGDEALIEYARRFDGAELLPSTLAVPAAEMERAHAECDSTLLEVIREAIGNITRFHRKSIPRSWIDWEADGVVLGQRAIPLERVGLYVPGGRAAYPSSLIMAAAPAIAAGVSEIVVVTPCGADLQVNPVILATVYELGITRLFRVGGSQAIAALAFGTQSIPRVDKIAGPGNIYVAAAKKLLFGQCGIDMVAGPSEVLVVADESAEPAFVAADLLAQAEHDPLASSLLVTDSESLALAVQREVTGQYAALQRREILSRSLAEYGAILLSSGLDESVALANRLAPEHLGLHLRDPWSVLGGIRTAGAIFLGSWSPETVGDYWAGPNHILPTNGTGRFFSPLRTEDFFKFSSVISYSREALTRHADKIARFALAEGLDAHANAVTKRVQNDG
ncbi:MAG TPA: histidinol dehydrogenase [bacterium]|nr:histidinol dehydrogenase [bacterium]